MKTTRYFLEIIWGVQIEISHSDFKKLKTELKTWVEESMDNSEITEEEFDTYKVKEWSYQQDETLYVLKKKTCKKGYCWLKGEDLPAKIVISEEFKDES